MKKNILKGLLSVIWILGMSACTFVPYTVPDGAEILFFCDKSELDFGESVKITIRCLSTTEEIVRDYSRIYLTATLGNIPEYADLIAGKAEVEFVAGNKQGTAEINARSGSLTAGPFKFTIGPKILSQLIITAEPETLPSRGGTSRIRVTAQDEKSNPIPDITFLLTATYGHFTSGGGTQTTDETGQANAVLYTEMTSVVKAQSGSKSAQITITVPNNQKPSPYFIYSPTIPKKGELVYFNASQSSDSDGEIVKYQWDFGDGNSGTGKMVSHSFTWEGTEVTEKTFRVTLVVTDDAGDTGVKTDSITVK